MNLIDQKRSSSAFTNKKKVPGLLKQGQIMNNIKTIYSKNQILPSQSQKNIKSLINSNRKVDIKSRPNTGGSKNSIRSQTSIMINKDRSRFGKYP